MIQAPIDVVRNWVFRRHRTIEQVEAQERQRQRDCASNQREERLSTNIDARSPASSTDGRRMAI